VRRLLFSLLLVPCCAGLAAACPRAAYHAHACAPAYAPASGVPVYGAVAPALYLTQPFQVTQSYQAQAYAAPAYAAPAPCVCPQPAPAPAPAPAPTPSPFSAPAPASYAPAPAMPYAAAQSYQADTYAAPAYNAPSYAGVSYAGSAYGPGLAATGYYGAYRARTAALLPATFAAVPVGSYYARRAAFVGVSAPFVSVRAGGVFLPAAVAVPAGRHHEVHRSRTHTVDKVRTR
jgi:hypothetical protein